MIDRSRGGHRALRLVPPRPADRRDQDALEPAVLDNKYYVRGIGEVAELAVKGPREAVRLVEIIS